MLKNWKVDASLALTVFAALFLVGCSSASDYQAPGNPSTEAQAQSASVDSQMRHMDTPAKRSETSKGRTSSANAKEILIENFSFQPAILTVKAETRITWVNRDDEPHTATDDDQRFNSKTLDTNDQFSFTFTQPGTYNYFCALHPKMRGQIVVK